MAKKLKAPKGWKMEPIKFAEKKGEKKSLKDKFVGFKKGY